MCRVQKKAGYDFKRFVFELNARAEGFGDGFGFEMKVDIFEMKGNGVNKNFHIAGGVFFCDDLTGWVFRETPIEYSDNFKTFHLH